MTRPRTPGEPHETLSPEALPRSEYPEGATRCMYATVCGDAENLGKGSGERQLIY